MTVCPTCGKCIDEFAKEARKKYSCGKRQRRFMLLQHRLKENCVGRMDI